MTHKAMRNQLIPSMPVCVPNALAKNAAAANKVNAMNFLNVSIHGPGLGSMLMYLGKNESKT